MPDVAYVTEFDGWLTAGLNLTNPNFRQQGKARAPASAGQPLCSLSTQLNPVHGNASRPCANDPCSSSHCPSYPHRDHGYHLGEHGEWAKHTNFELNHRVPLLIRAPWKPASAGRHVNHTFVELLDLYRTIVALTEPGMEVEEDVEGQDLSVLFDDPDQVGFRTWRAGEVRAS